MALIEKLQAIGDAIRAKTGGTEELTLDDMATEIESISGGGDFPDITFTDFNYLNYEGQLDWLFNNYLNKTTFRSQNFSMIQMFSYSSLTDLSNVILYFVSSPNVTLTFSQTFSNCYDLTKLPLIRIIDTLKYTISSGYRTFYMCHKLTTESINNFFDTNVVKQNTSSQDFEWRECFSNCFNLRSLPDIFTNGLGYSHYSNVFNNMKYKDTFNGCISLDEINDLEDSFIMADTNVNRSSAMHYQNIVANCGRLKNFTFKTNNGVPYEAKWSNMLLDFTSRVGWFDNAFKPYLLTYTNIGNDKKVTDATSYEALKNDPDWWTEDVAYSRYNHDSAVRTINSLPDFSTGSKNTIKFKGAAGSATDGGAINTLTEAEIAVATAKGWTVTLV